MGTIPYDEYQNIKLDDRIAKMNIVQPAKIVEYDYELQKAKVQPALNVSNNAGDEFPQPQIHNVPVMQYASGNAGFFLPVQVGDNVLLQHSQRSLEEWLQNGSQVTPDDPRLNDLTDAVASLGLKDFSKKSLATNNNDLLITYAGAEIRIKQSGEIDISCSKAELKINDLKVTGNLEVSGNVKISGNLDVSQKITGQNVEASVEVKTQTLNIANKDFTLHTHLGVTPGGGTSGTVTP